MSRHCSTMLAALLLLPAPALAQETLWPAPRASHDLAWHGDLGLVVLHGGGPENPARERVVLFGGIHDGERYADLWEWDGAAWEPIYPD